MSNVSSIYEVVGTTAELFDPKNLGDMTMTVERVVFDETCRAALTATGR